MYLASPWTCLQKIAGNDREFIQLTIENLQLPSPQENTLEIVPEFPRLIELVKLTWQANPNDRPTMDYFYNKVSNKEAPRGLKLRKPNNDVAVDSRPEAGLKSFTKGIIRSVRSLGVCFRPFAKELEWKVKTQDIPNDCAGSVNLDNGTVDNLWTRSQIGCSANSCPQFKPLSFISYKESVSKENTYEELDPFMSQALTLTSVTLRPDCSLTSPITRQKLLRVSENTEKHLKKTDLLSVKKNKTAGWKFIQDRHLYLYNAIQILENITTEVGDELAFPETNPNQHSLFMESRLEHHDTNHTNEALFESFKKLSARVSHCCSQTIVFVAIYLQEDINLCASAMLLPAALSLLKLYNRLIEAKKVLQARVDLRHFSSWPEGTDETRADCVKQLMKASSAYVLRMLNRYILPVCKEKGETGAPSEDVSELISSISDAWQWLKELSKRSVTLCQSIHKDIEICLLETCMEAADKLSNTRLMLYIQNRLRGKMELTKDEKSKHETTVLSFLVPLFENAKEIKSHLENCGLISVAEFPQISEASTKFGNLSNVLKAACLKVGDSANDRSLLSAEIEPDCSILAAKLVRNFFGILLICVSKVSHSITSYSNSELIQLKGLHQITTFKEILSGLCTQLDHLEYKLHLSANLIQPRPFMVYGSPGVSSEATPTHDDVESLVSNSSTNPSTSNAEEAAPRSTEEQASTVNKGSPLGHSYNHLPASETDPSQTRLTTTGIPASVDAEEHNSVQIFSQYNKSIDRSLKSMPSGSYFFCASADDASKGPYCDEGSSGTIYKNYEGTTPIAIKESKCKDRAIASKRLQKEATIHQKLNSNRNIVRFLGTCTETDESGEIHTKGIKTEWCQFGDLRNAIQEAKWLELLEQEGNDISNMKDSVSYALYKNWIKRIEGKKEAPRGLKLGKATKVIDVESQSDPRLKRLTKGVLGGVRSFGVCFRPFAKELEWKVTTQHIPNDYAGSVNLKDRTENNLWTRSQVCCSVNSCSRFAISPSSLYNGSVTRENTFEELDPFMSQALTPDSVTLRPDCSLTSPITRQKLLRASENTERYLKKTDLLSVKKNKKAGWKFIQDRHLYLYHAIQILDNIAIEIGDELAFPQTNPNHYALSMESRLEYPDTVNTSKALFESYKRLSARVSHCCSQMIALVAIYLQEDINLCASALLLPVALSFLKLYSRLIEAKKVLRARIDFRHFSSWTEETDETRASYVEQLLQASSSYVIRLLNRYILTVCKDHGETGASSEAVNKLVSSMSDAWQWLKELSKRSVILCPSIQKNIETCLLETFMEAADRLSNTTQTLYIQDRIRGKIELTKDEKSEYETTVLSSLVPLFENAEEIKSDLERSGLISVEEFPKISEASTKFGNLSNVLKAACLKVGDSVVSQSSSSADIKPDCSALAANLVRNFFEILLIGVSEGLNEVASLKKILSGLCAQLDYLKYKLRLPMNLIQQMPIVVSQSPDVSSEATPTHDDDVGSLVRNSGSNPSTSNAEESAPRSAEEQASTVNNRSPFGHLHNHPPASETNPSQTELTTTAPSEFVYTEENNYVQIFSQYDESIDRSLKSMPSGTYFFCASANDVSKGPHCDEGSSGTIYKKYEGTTSIAIKKSKCKDSAVASKRLQKEATIHQKLNSNRNIVRFLGTCTETDESGEIHTKGIKTEWCQFGDLRKSIQEAKWLEQLEHDGRDISDMRDRVGYALYKNWIKRIEVITDVASGLAYMHGCNVVHRDLTCRNVLLASADKNGEFVAKICDFERGFYLKDGEPIKRLSPAVNSVPWMGREVLKKEKYGLKADVFSIGTLLWQLMYLGNPWTCLKEITGNDESFIKYQLTYGNLKLPISENDAPENIPEFPRLVELVESAWQTNPENRPSMAEFYATITSILESMKTRRFLENVI
eukprot:g5159.t1